MDGLLLAGNLGIVGPGAPSKTLIYPLLSLSALESGDEIGWCDIPRHVPRPREYHGGHTQRNAPESEHPLKVTNKVFEVFMDRDDNPFTGLLRQNLDQASWGRRPRRQKGCTAGNVRSPHWWVDEDFSVLQNWRAANVWNHKGSSAVLPILVRSAYVDDLYTCSEPRNS